jgi:hypothetical protein
MCGLADTGRRGTSSMQHASHMFIANPFLQPPAAFPSILRTGRTLSRPLLPLQAF